MNSLTADYGKISTTAKMTAYWKSKTDIVWAKEIADRIGARQEVLQLAEDADSPASLFSIITMEARYKAISHAIARTGIKNILEVACGLSPRGLELACQQYTYVGSDLPGIAAEVFPVIRDIAEQENIPQEKLHLLAVNILDKRQVENAVDYFGKRPFVLCHEGLLMYFDHQEKAKAAENIRGVIANKGGVWITTDLAFHEGMFEMMNANGNVDPIAEDIKKRLGRIYDETGRDILQNRFSGSSEAVKFYADLGFIIHEYPMYDRSYELSSLSGISQDIRTMMTEGLSSLKVWTLESTG